MMVLADLDSAIQMGLICGAIGGVVGGVIGLINWLVRGGRKRGKASDYTAWAKQDNPPQDKGDGK